VIKMFCYNVRRKLYDFIGGGLEKGIMKGIEAHLLFCPKCAREHRELKEIMKLASEKKAPQLSGGFWRDFDTGLKEKLAKAREMPQAFRLRPERPRISLKPAYALATILILLVAVNFYFFGGMPTKSRLEAMADERLVNDIVILEELADEAFALDEGDFLLDEFFLLEEIDNANGSA